MSSLRASAILHAAIVGERAVASVSNLNRNDNPRPPQAGD